MSTEKHTIDMWINLIAEIENTRTITQIFQHKVQQIKSKDLGIVDTLNNKWEVCNLIWQVSLHKI